MITIIIYDWERISAMPQKALKQNKKHKATEQKQWLKQMKKDKDYVIKKS